MKIVSKDILIKLRALITSAKKDKIQDFIEEFPDSLGALIRNGLPIMQAEEQLVKWTNKNNLDPQPMFLEQVEAYKELVPFIRDKTILLAIDTEDLEILEYMDSNCIHTTTPLSNGVRPKNYAIERNATSIIEWYQSKEMKLSSGLLSQVKSLDTTFSRRLQISEDIRSAEAACAMQNLEDSSALVEELKTLSMTTSRS